MHVVKIGLIYTLVPAGEGILMAKPLTPAGEREQHCPALQLEMPQIVSWR